MPKTTRVKRQTPEQKVRLMLWDVLSAIRGPDSQELRLKQLVYHSHSSRGVPASSKSPDEPRADEAGFFPPSRPTGC